MPTRRFYQFAACAVAAFALAPRGAHAVVFKSTGDPTFNTAAPTGSLANSGWQYQLNIGAHLGTAVGPHHFLTAKHIGGTGQFVHDGELFTPTFVKDYGDLRLLRVDKTFHSYAPLYEATDGDEVGEDIVIIGRGTQRGGVNTAGGITRGWNWGTADGVRRWGENAISGTATDANGGAYLRFNFDTSGGVNEAIMTDGDSGGGTFINVNGQWKIAGINSGVTGHYSETANGPKFLAALYNTNGLFEHSSGAPLPSSGPSGAFASRVSTSAANIKTFLNLPPTWKTNGDGNWEAAANWANGGPPTVFGGTVDFRTAITAPRTVTLTQPAGGIGTINFDSPHRYTIAGNAGLSMAGTTMNGNAINVVSGSHTIAVPVQISDPASFNVMSAGSTLTLSNNLNVVTTLTKKGPGRVEVKHVRGSNLGVNAGAMAVLPNGTSAATSRVGNLTVAAGATLDLNDNDLVVVANTPVGTSNGTTYTGLTGLIAQGRGGNAEWAGPGIVSSTAATPNSVTTLGIARAGDVLNFANGSTTTWSGQTVTPNSALIAYTYGGDANLDGFVSADDYTKIDFGIGQAGASGWVNGDFNYDGFISADDYTIIDFAIANQGQPLIASAAGSMSASALQGVSAVPEPGSASLVAIAASALLARRSRRSRAAAR